MIKYSLHSISIKEPLWMTKPYQNWIVVLMGFAGSGKRTIGEALSKKVGFKFVHHHSWTDPILNLLGDDGTVWWDLNEKGWQKLNDARDVIFSTIADVCPKTSNFVITYEMINKDPYHKIFYDKVFEIVKKRQAFFLPVRLVCDEDELVTRAQTEDRKKYFKTCDTELIRSRFREKLVFYSEHKNEITINNTEKSPAQVISIIIDKINQITMDM